MILYLLVAIWPLILHEIYAHHRLSARERVYSKETHIVLAMLPMFVMIGFRGRTMGADTGVYINHFIQIMPYSLNEAIESTRMEAGYVLFAKLIGTYVTQNPLIYQLICTMIYFIGIFKFAIEQEEKDAFLFLYFFNTLGLFTFMFTGVRQCLAMSICLFSYQFAKQKKIVKFLLCVILASCFHKSAILFVVVYLIKDRKITFYNVGLYGVLVFISTTYLESIQEWFNEQMEYEYAIENTGNGNIFLIVMMLLTAFSMYCLFSYKIINAYSQALLNVNFIAVFFWILRPWTRVAERPSYYFLFFTCALVAFCLNRIPNTRYRILFKLAIIGCTLFLFYYRMKTNFTSFLPYRFY